MYTFLVFLFYYLTNLEKNDKILERKKSKVAKLCDGAFSPEGRAERNANSKMGVLRFLYLQRPKKCGTVRIKISRAEAL